MSFEKKEWKYRDTITADELNRMEGGIEEALSGSAGYECKEEYTLLIDESVTTVIREGRDYAAAPLASSSKVNAETVRVTFDDTEYICVGRQEFGMEYGALWSDETQSFDWSEYPFSIGSNDLGNSISTQTAGTHQVKIEALEYSIETSECFEKAVKSVSGGTSEPLVIKWVRTDTTSNREYYDARFDDVDSALRDDRAVYVRINGNGWYPVFYASSPDDAVLFYDYRKGKVAQLKRDTGSDSHLYIQTESPK